MLELQKQCRNIQSDPEVEKVIKKYQRKTASKEELKEIFTKKLSSMSPAVRSKIGINDAGSIENFITSTCCFENQFLYEIQRDTTLKSIVREELIDGCVISTAREYGLNKVQKDTLRIALSDEKNENIDSLKVILESPKLRKKRVKKYLKEEVQIIKIEDQIDLQFLHNQIINKLDPTHSETKKIQSAWLAMIS